jgi:hypothetical protein
MTRPNTTMTTTTVRRRAGALGVGGLLLAVLGPALVRASRPVVVVAVVVVAVLVAVIARGAVPGGIALSGLNMTTPCPGLPGMGCVHYGYPPAGQPLVRVDLPGGGVTAVCPPCAAGPRGALCPSATTSATQPGTDHRQVQS